MEKLNYSNGGVTLNFNLREPKKVNGATNVYAVMKVQGKQIKLPINCKINAWQWDAKKQVPRFTNNMTEQDRANNMQINSIISKIHSGCRLRVSWSLNRLVIKKYFGVKYWNVNLA